VVGTTTYVAWLRDDRAVAADNGGGSFASHTFNTPAIQHGPPAVAVSSGSVVVGWTVPTTPFRAFVAKRVGTTWTGTYASPASATREQFLQGVAPRGGKATAVILSLRSRLYATTETGRPVKARRPGRHRTGGAGGQQPGCRDGPAVATLHSSGWERAAAPLLPASFHRP
jgi:hypothetical protein